MTCFVSPAGPDRERAGGGAGGDEDDAAPAIDKKKKEEIGGEEGESGSAGDDDDDTERERERAATQKKKRRRVDDAERAWLLLREAAASNSNNNTTTTTTSTDTRVNNNDDGDGKGKKGQAAAGAGGSRTDNHTQQEKGWLARYGATIIGNLVITVTNVHVRYEDDITTPGHPFAAGVTVARLAAITVDENGAESFISSDSFSRVRKRVQLERLAVYFDDGRGASTRRGTAEHGDATVQWVPERGWESMGPDDGAEWRKMFMPGIQSDDENNEGSRLVDISTPSSWWGADVREKGVGSRRAGEPRQALDFRMGSVRCTSGAATAGRPPLGRIQCAPVTATRTPSPWSYSGGEQKNLSPMVAPKEWWAALRR